LDPIVSKNIGLYKNIVFISQYFIELYFSCMALKIGRFGQQIRNTWKVLKCGAEEVWRRSVGPIA
jgi:hypothetical protein